MAVADNEAALDNLQHAFHSVIRSLADTLYFIQQKSIDPAFQAPEGLSTVHVKAVFTALQQSAKSLSQLKEVLNDEERDRYMEKLIKEERAIDEEIPNALKEAEDLQEELLELLKASLSSNISIIEGASDTEEARTKDQVDTKQ